MSAGEDENVPTQENGQLESFFITECVEAELVATGYEVEPPNHTRTTSSAAVGRAHLVNPSRNSMSKWMLRYSAEPNLWMRVTEPVCAECCVLYCGF